MSGIEAEKVYEYFSSVKEAREYINKRIENLIQVIEQRKSFLNCQLDGLESTIEKDETQGKEMLEKLVEYEKSTVDLFDIDDPEHLHIIQSRIVAIESELSRKKLKLEWMETGLEKQLESLGNVSYVQDQGAINPDIYENIIIQNRKPGNQIPISGEGSYSDEGGYEIPKEVKPLVFMPSSNSKKPVLSLDVFDDVNYPPHSVTTNKGFVLNKMDDEDDDKIIYETMNSEDPREGKQNEYSYKEQWQQELKRHHSFSEIKIISTSPKSHKCSLDNYSDYEVMDNSYLTILEDPLTREYEKIDEQTLIDMPNTGSKQKVEKSSNVKAKTLGRAKLKAKYDLPQIANCWKGSGIEQLDRPKAVRISEKGNIFVAEKGNNRVQVFSSEGNHLLTFGEKSGANKMVEPNGICVYREFVYVTLPNKHIVQQYTVQGGFIKQKGKKGSEEGMFKLPTGIDGDDSRGKIYICDTGNNRIQIFDSKLRFIKSLQTNSLVKPLDIKIIKNGDFIVLDRSPRCIHFFNNSGEHLKDIINVSSHLQLVNPLYFTVSREGDIILSDYSKDCIHIFTVEGDYVWTLGEAGSGKPFVEPRGVACDRDGRLVTVCNKNYEMLQIFKI